MLRVRERWVARKPRVRPSLEHLDRERSAALEPPWPDLVLTIGRRPSMAALWIREQSALRTRLVLLGKPSGRLADFDLVVASSEIQLPALPNVLRIALPLLRVEEAAVARAAEAWRPRLAELPRPLIAFLVGGPTLPFRWDASVAERLAALARRCAEEGGTPYFSTSRRTPAALVDALEGRLPAAARLYRFSPDDAENPYPALLGLADGFVATGDSISMLVEVARLGRPLAIAELPASRLGALDQRRRALSRRLFAPASASARSRLRAALGRAAHRGGLLPATRDFGAFHRLLRDLGLAVRAGEPLAPPRAPVPDDLAAVVERVRALSPLAPR